MTSDSGEDGQERGLSELPGCGEARLLRQGWTRRFVASPARLAEVRELYQGLGLEVRFEPVLAEDLPPGCDDCRAAMALFRVVYTRERRTRA